MQIKNAEDSPRLIKKLRNTQTYVFLNKQSISLKAVSLHFVI